MYRLAAVQGHADAQYNLADMLRFGHGVAQDDVEAIRFYRLAAAQGKMQSP
jgi:TPR repeat protein